MLDEPSLGLASIMVQEIGRLIEGDQQGAGLSIVLVEQNADLALKLCHDAYVPENGRIALSGPVPELARSELCSARLPWRLTVLGSTFPAAADRFVLRA